MGLQYRVDGPSEIEDLFAREDDSLTRSGFRLPDLSSEPEGFSESAVFEQVVRAAKSAGSVTMRASTRN
jgi:hypothetical protein